MVKRKRNGFAKGNIIQLTDKFKNYTKKPITLKMKNLNTLKKIGLATLIALPLTFGLAESKEINPKGYETPDLTDLSPKDVRIGLINGQPRIYMERFYTENKRVDKMYYDNGKDKKLFGYFLDHYKPEEPDYGIYDMDGDGLFESKYDADEALDLPEWVKEDKK